MQASVTKEKLDEINDEIDRSISSELLQSVPRNLAVINLLRFYEDYMRFYLPGNIPEERLREGTLDAQDSLHFVMIWIHKFCSEDVATSRFKHSDFSTQQKCAILMSEASLYSKTWDLLSLLYRGSFRGEISEENHITITYADPSMSESEVADLLLNSTDPPDMDSNLLAPIFKNQRQILKECNPRKLRHDQLEYSFPISTFKKVRNALEQQTGFLWELPSTMSFGAYTLAQFKSVWLAISARTQIHMWVCINASRSDVLKLEGVAIDSLVETKSAEAWANELSRLAKLPFTTVLAIVSDLTFDYSLQLRSKQKLPGVLYTPFFRVGRNQLALSNQIVIASNPERNIWALLGSLRKPVQDRLKYEKENHWLLSLKEKFEQRGFKFFQTIKFSFDGKPSDLDALVIDEQRNEALVLELKWNAAPDKLNEIATIIGDLRKAVDQVEHSLAWMENNPEAVADRTGIDLQLLKSCKFFGVALSKNCIGKGQVKHSRVMVSSERLMNWILFNPHNATIGEFWATLSKQGYLPQKGIHYDEFDLSFSFGDYKFTAKNIGLQMKEKYQPEKDLVVSSNAPVAQRSKKQ